ncbi:hypothetical protein H4582DRAFT_1472497 [Lactarius indigo]|nr:hypothetical protein H4582DRAFT_1472497 [Lactarius indigo]
MYKLGLLSVIDILSEFFRLDLRYLSLRWEVFPDVRVSCRHSLCLGYLTLPVLPATPRSILKRQETANRVEEISKRRGISMVQVSLVWSLTRVTAPVIGSTEYHE